LLAYYNSKEWRSWDVFCEKHIMRSLTAEKRANRGREGGEEKEIEREKERKRK